MNEIQFVHSRLTEELNPTKIRVMVAHDLADDPLYSYLDNNGWEKFHLLVFVSNNQMQSFIARYNIPWSKCLVLRNAITPIDVSTRNRTDDKIRLIYTSVPRKGLPILEPVFAKLCEDYDNLELDVYSSFALYGWPEADKSYQQLFDKLNENPKVRNHGTVPNDEIRQALVNADIFAYPSIFAETSCLCLIEAMSAQCRCVHPNYGALAETSLYLTYMYQWQDTLNAHAHMFYNVLKVAIEDEINERDNFLQSQKKITDLQYSWDHRIEQWENVLGGLVASVRDRSLPALKTDSFVYTTRR